MCSWDPILGVIETSMVSDQLMWLMRFLWWIWKDLLVSVELTPSFWDHTRVWLRDAMSDFNLTRSVLALCQVDNCLSWVLTLGCVINNDPWISVMVELSKYNRPIIITIEVVAEIGFWTWIENGWSDPLLVLLLPYKWLDGFRCAWAHNLRTVLVREYHSWGRYTDARG